MNTSDFTNTPRFPAPLAWNPGWSETTWDDSITDRLSNLDFDVVVSRPRPALENLALDVVLQKQCAAGKRRPVFWIWDWAESAVVLGSFQSVTNEFDEAGAAQRGFRFVRRMSGGGAMIVEPSRTVTYSLIAPEAVVAGLSYVPSFAYLDRWIVRALRTIGVPATYKPINDIASPIAKIGGAAQARRWGTVLHHATMAYEMDASLLTTVLRLGKPKSESKGTPSAEKQVSPLSMYTSYSYHELRAYLAHSFAAQYNCIPGEITEEEESLAQDLIATKLGTEEWLWRVR